MKELEQKAEQLIDKFRKYVDSEGGETSFTYSKRQETKNATQCAIQSVTHTIALLERMDKEIYNIEPYLDEQIELKKILESRL
jgi:hypothetical protein